MRLASRPRGAGGASPGMAPADQRVVVRRESPAKTTAPRQAPSAGSRDRWRRQRRPAARQRSPARRGIGQKYAKGEHRADQEHFPPAPARQGQAGEEEDERREGTGIDAVDEARGYHGDGREAHRPSRYRGRRRGAPGRRPLRGRRAAFPAPRHEEPGQPVADLRVALQENVPEPQGGNGLDLGPDRGGEGRKLPRTRPGPSGRGAEGPRRPRRWTRAWGPRWRGTPRRSDSLECNSRIGLSRRSVPISSAFRRPRRKGLRQAQASRSRRSVRLEPLRSINSTRS